jgi:hypothetical protein
LLCEKGSAGNRGRAATAKKAGFQYASILDPCRQSENISTNRVADFNRGRRSCQLSGIARMAEVIEDGCAEHFPKVSRQAGKV